MVASTAGSTWLSTTNTTLRDSCTFVARGNLFGLLCCPAFFVWRTSSTRTARTPNRSWRMSTWSPVVSNPGVGIRMTLWSTVGDTSKSQTPKSSSSCSLGKTVLVVVLFVVIRLSWPWSPSISVTNSRACNNLSRCSVLNGPSEFGSVTTYPFPPGFGRSNTRHMFLLPSCPTFWIYLWSWHSWRRLCTLPAGLRYSQTYHSVSSPSGTHFRCTFMPRGKHLSGVVDG